MAQFIGGRAPRVLISQLKKLDEENPIQAAAARLKELPDEFQTSVEPTARQQVVTSEQENLNGLMSWFEEHAALHRATERRRAVSTIQCWGCRALALESVNTESERRQTKAISHLQSEEVLRRRYMMHQEGVERNHSRDALAFARISGAAKALEDTHLEKRGFVETQWKQTLVELSEPYLQAQVEFRKGSERDKLKTQEQTQRVTFQLKAECAIVELREQSTREEVQLLQAKAHQRFEGSVEQDFVLTSQRQDFEVKVWDHRIELMVDEDIAFEDVVAAAVKFRRSKLAVASATIQRVGRQRSSKSNFHHNRFSPRVTVDFQYYRSQQIEQAMLDLVVDLFRDRDASEQLEEIERRIVALQHFECCSRRRTPEAEAMVRGFYWVREIREREAMERDRLLTLEAKLASLHFASFNIDQNEAHVRADNLLDPEASAWFDLQEAAKKSADKSHKRATIRAKLRRHRQLQIDAEGTSRKLIEHEEFLRFHAIAMASVPDVMDDEEELLFEETMLLDTGNEVEFSGPREDAANNPFASVEWFAQDLLAVEEQEDPPQQSLATPQRHGQLPPLQHKPGSVKQQQNVQPAAATCF